jgi:hypothetical protein
MNSSIPENTLHQQHLYPYLGIRQKGDSTIIVLFSEKGRGVLVYKDGDHVYNIGDYCSGWSEETFSVYQSTVTLSN